MIFFSKKLVVCVNLQNNMLENPPKLNFCRKRAALHDPAEHKGFVVRHAGVQRVPEDVRQPMHRRSHHQHACRCFQVVGQYCCLCLWLCPCPTKFQILPNIAPKKAFTQIVD